MAADANKKQQQKAKKELKRKKKLEAAKKLERQKRNEGAGLFVYAKIDHALVCADSGDFEGGEAQLDRLKVKYADKSYLHFAFGVIKIKSNNAEASIPHFEKAIELEPAFIQAHMNLARVYLSLGKYDLAVKYFTEVTKLKDRDAQLAQEAEAELDRIKNL